MGELPAGNGGGSLILAVSAAVAAVTTGGLVTLGANVLDEFGAHPLAYLAMPALGAFIGWITKVLAIEMIFWPLEFRGIGPIGWQGQLPRRAARFASHAADNVLGRLVDPHELLDRLDANAMARELDEIMLELLDELATEIAGRAWTELPARAQSAVIARARARAPRMIESLLAQAHDNIDDLFDLRYIATDTLIRDKVLLNRLVRDTIPAEMRFMKRFGTAFGGAVGLVQMVVFAATQSHILIPLFGLAVGLVSDWIALQMVFYPRERRRFLGLIWWHGLFFANRDQFARTYARLGAEHVLKPSVVMEALLSGPLADRLFAMIEREVRQAVDAEAGLARPLVGLTVGSARYDEVKDRVVARARATVPRAAERLEDYAADALRVEETAYTGLSAMSDDEYESMIRPVFKDDEWLVVAVGGALGFGVGELQVFLLTHFAGL